MLFAYIDDGSLSVVADEEEARQKYESTDVESGAVRLFDSGGRPLAPRFPNRSEKRFLGMRIASDPGPFTLTPAAESDAESLLDAMGPIVVLVPNRWFKDLDSVKAHLRQQ